MNPNKRRSLQNLSVSLATLPRWLPPAIAAVGLPRHAQATPAPLCTVTDVVGTWFLEEGDAVHAIELFPDGTGTDAFSEPLSWKMENDIVTIELSLGISPTIFTGALNASCNEINGTDDGGYSFRAIKDSSG